MTAALLLLPGRSPEAVGLLLLIELFRFTGTDLFSHTAVGNQGAESAGMYEIEVVHARVVV